MENMKKNRVNSSLLRKFVGFSAASWIGAGFSFLLTPLITRVILPDELGKIDVFITYCNVFIYAATLGMHQSYIRFYRELPPGFNKDSILSFSVKVAAVGAAFVGLGAVLFYRSLSVAVLGYTSIWISICMVIYVFAMGFLDIVKTKPRLEAKIIPYTVIVVLMSVLLKATYLSYRLFSETLYTICCITAVMLLLAAIVAAIERRSIFASTAAIEKSSAITVFKYALPTVPAMLMSNLNTALPKLILNMFWSKNIVGIYAGALTLVSIIQLVQKGFSVFWSPYVFENYSTKQKEIQKINMLVVFGMTACGLGLLLFQDVIYMILGSAYRESRNIYALLLASPIMYTIGETVGIGIYIKKKTYLNVLITGCNLIAMAALGWILIPHYGNIGAAISVCVSASVSLVLRLIIGGKYYCVACSKSKIAIALLLYLGAAVVSFSLSEQWMLRSGMILLILIALSVTFKTEAKSVLKLLQKLYQKAESN